MSSKPGRRPWPLAVRLTAWYSLAVLALLAAAVAALHVSILWESEREEAEAVGPALAKVHANREVFLRLPETDDEDSLLRVIVPDGRVVRESPLLASEFVPSAFPPPDGRAEARSADGTRYVLFTRDFDGWRYQIAFGRWGERRFVSLVYRNVALIIVPMLVAAVLAGLLIARAGLRPLRRVAAEVRAVSADRLDRRVDSLSVPSDLAHVADSFNVTMGRLESAVARLDQFAADVAHELRTPVHNLRTAAELALRSDRPAGEYRRTLAGVVDEADRVARLIDRLLLLARLTDPRAGLALERADVATELANLAEFFEPAATEAGVAVAVRAAAGLTHSLDRPLFQRAVSNLIANALAHTPTGGQIELRASTGPIGLTVEVTDTGSGISADAVPHLFDRYFRSRTTNGRGLGLGLAIVKRVTELHGGSAMIRSSLGAGTTVLLHFPANPRHDDTAVMNLTQQ